MKRLLLILTAALSLALTSCYKESHYTVQYLDRDTEVANVTLFEYDYSFDLVKTQELKFVDPDKIYEITSSDLAHYVVVGVEGIVGGHIIEWYSAHYYQLDSSNPIHLDISFVDMDVSDQNPVDPNHRVHQYLHK